MARRYVSVKEIAAKAGVSFQTASKVLNGGNVRVSAETAARIIEVAEKLGYRPNTVARSLVQRTTATIGLVTGDLTDGALSQFAVSAEQTARRHQHAVLIGNLAEHDAGVLDRVVHVDVQIALGLDGEVEAAVAGEALQHVVVEADAGGDMRLPGPVEIDGDPHLGLLGVAPDVRDPAHAAAVCGGPAPLSRAKRALLA